MKIGSRFDNLKRLFNDTKLSSNPIILPNFIKIGIKLLKIISHRIYIGQIIAVAETENIFKENYFRFNNNFCNS